MQPLQGTYVHTLYTIPYHRACISNIYTIGVDTMSAHNKLVLTAIICNYSETEALHLQKIYGGKILSKTINKITLKSADILHLTETLSTMEIKRFSGSITLEKE